MLAISAPSARFAMEPGGVRVLLTVDSQEDVGAVDGGAWVDVARVLLTADSQLDVAPVLLAVNSQVNVVLDLKEDGGAVDVGARVLLAADDVCPESEEVVVVDVVQDSVDIVPDSVEMVPESLPPGAFVCGRCHLVHEDREAWNRAHSRFYPCPRCGLIHADYSIDAMLGHINVDCELFMEHYKGLLPTKEYAKASQE